LPKKRFGIAFIDELKKVQHKSTVGRSKNSDWQDNLLAGFSEQLGNNVPLSRWRITLFGCVTLLIVSVIFLRLFHLQVVNGSLNRELADSNRIKLRIIHAPRGVIYDRNTRVLAQSNPGFRLNGKFISRDEVLIMEAKKDIRTQDLEVDTIRDYPFGTISAHILGYLGEVAPNEMKNYRLGDKIGRGGIEQIYEKNLKGQDGAEIIEVDAEGHQKQLLRKIDPIPGQNLYLGIDIDLQKVSFFSLEAQLKKLDVCCGVVIGENPTTGEILSLVSLPSFDGNAFNDPNQTTEVGRFFIDPNSPLLNRAIAGTYPPGSTFKIASSLAALASGKFKPDDEVLDTGVMHFGPYSFANWYFTEYGKTEGQVNILKAIQRSNDIYFYHVGDTVGETFLGEIAKKVGFGKKIGIDLPGEADGLIPDDKWKQKNVKESWYPGDTLHMAIGQGFVLATPLQVLAQTAFIAAEGKLYLPHLVTRITNPNDSVFKQFLPVPIIQNEFPVEYIKIIADGLAQVTKNGGTAWPFFNFSIPTSGKTGTAEYSDKNRTHGWYTSYAPSSQPEIALTVLIEGGGEGSNVAAPVSKSIYTWYFSPDKTHLKNFDLAPIATDSARKFGE